MSEIVRVELSAPKHQYQIRIGNNLIKESGIWAKSCLPQTARKIAVISNPKVFSLYGEGIVKSLKNQDYEVFVYKIGDGEKFKSLRTFEKVLMFFSESGITRSDAAVALGGGVVGDLTGFAASAFLRGIKFLQIPTTLLSMIDSSVGGKTGVNSSFGKNLIGAFHQPSGVLIDIDTLQTLPSREITAGFCEAVKQGAIADQPLLEKTAELLKEYPNKDFRKHFSTADFREKLCSLIALQVGFKAEIVANDERENLAREDGKSRKILNFGHTLAHALEKVTDYKYFKHGEAVGLGIIAAAEISKKVANFGQNELTLLKDVVSLTGKLPDCSKIDVEKVIEAFKFDKKNVGDSLQWVLLNGIGKPIVFANSRIPESTLIESIKIAFR